MAEQEYKIRIPSANKREEVRQSLMENEDHQIPKVSLAKDGDPKFMIRVPTSDDPDNMKLTKAVYAVVLAAREVFFADKANPEAPKKECRNLYILRGGSVNEAGKVPDGAYEPEFILVSKSSLQNWLGFCALLSTRFKQSTPGIPKGTPFQHVLVKFTGVPTTFKGFTWNKLVITPIRVLTEKEIGWVDELIPMTEGCIKNYDTLESLRSAESEVISGKSVDDDEEDGSAAAKSTRVKLASDDDEEEQAAPTTTKRKKAADAPPPVAPPVVAPVDDDEDESAAVAAPAARRRSVALPDDDDE